MELKSDAVKFFSHFKTLTENQFSTKIKAFQVDGASELVKGPFKVLLESSGILIRIHVLKTQNKMALLRESIGT